MRRLRYAIAGWCTTLIGAGAAVSVPWGLESWTDPPDSFGAPVEVSICELTADPARYDRQRVRVHGAVNLAFEEFSLDASGCPASSTRTNVWLEYGGSEETTAVYCCGDHRKRRPGGLEGSDVGLVVDHEFELLKARLSARRLAPPDGGSCEGRSCAFDDVRATLTGVFKAARASETNSYAGYGHMGCCSLLTIERVANVRAARTVVPAGGTYECRSDGGAAVPPGVVERFRAARRRCPPGDWTCRDKVEREFLSSVAAAMWQDTEPFSSLGIVDGPAISWSWPSADLLRRYTVGATHPEPAPGSPWSVKAERQTCIAVTPPIPQDAPMSCSTASFGPFVDGDGRLIDPAVSGDITDEGPGLLRGVVPHLDGGSPLFPSLSLTCSAVDLDPEKRYDWGLCRAMSRNALQAVDAAFQRPRSTRSDRHEPWRLVRATVTTCGAEPRASPH